MTANRRIILNILATYGRSLFGIACGLFSARWVLEALGKSDFGLYGVVGALTIFVSFINMLLSGALGRYYAFSIGEAKRAIDAGHEDEGLDNCRRWFNTALSIHTFVPIVLIIIGYPIGEWAVCHFLTIPPDRLNVCVWIWRLECVACFVGMVNVPFTAMYTAKQYIAELTIYSFVQTALNTIFFYFMATHPGDWLLRYAIWMCLLSVTPQAIITIRALYVFKECRLNFAYWWDYSRMKQLGSYAFWQMFGGLGYIFRTQAIAILVNKYFGPSVNASMSIANQTSAQTQTLAAAMQGAFQPAIATACGEGDIEKMRKMSFRACKFGMLLVLIFLIPLSLEIEEVMLLWLKNPPEYSAGLCWCMMAMLLIDKTTLGHMLAVAANGRIRDYQIFLGGALILTLPIAWTFVALGCSVYTVGFAMIITMGLCAWGRLFFARRLVGMSVRYWLVNVIIPVVISSIVPILGSLLVVHFANPSFVRVVATTLVCEMLFLPGAWFIALSKEERKYASGHILSRLPWRKRQ